MNEFIVYAAYGPNSDPAMIHAITGERARLVGRAAILDTALAVQRMDQTPDTPLAPGLPTPRDILVPNWGPDGESYVGIEHEGESIDAYILQLSPLANELMEDWELISLGWKRRKEVRVRLSSDGVETVAVTDFLVDGQEIDRIVNGHGYPTYLNSGIKMHILAREARLAYLARRQARD